MNLFVFLFLTSLVTLITNIHALPLSKNRKRSIQEPISIDILTTGFIEVVVPDDVKEIVPLPSWLIAWSDAEFVGKAEQYGVPLLGDSVNITVKAAAYLVSMTGGVWLPKYTVLARGLDLGPTEEAFVEYLATGRNEAIFKVQEAMSSLQTAAADEVMK